MSDDSKIVDFEAVRYTSKQRHGQRGYYSLKDLRQRPSIAEQCLSTGWKELDAIWRLYAGQFTVVTGIAGQGKSTFLLNVLCNLAKKHCTRSFLYVPENEGHLLDKMRGIWGPQGGFDDFCENLCYVQSANPEEYREMPFMNLPWVLDQARVAVEKDWTSVLLIDPWNELEHYKPANMLLTDYIRECLMHLKRYSRVANVSIILVAHPTKAVFEEKGKPRQPTLADIEGSMNWYNKCDNGLVITRNMELNTAKVISCKVREHGAGKVGACAFYVDPNTGVFTPQYGGEYRE